MTAAPAIKNQFFERESVGEDWPEPDMSILGGGRAPPVPMPSDLFGSVWPLIGDLAEGAGAPVEYTAVSFLTVSASLIGAKRKAQPFEETPDWQEPCIIWAANVGDPSTNKSPGQEAATRPLGEMEAAHARAFNSTLQDYETTRERARAERKAWEAQVKEATKEGHDTPRMPDAAVEPEPPARRRLKVTDATPEAMVVILSGNRFGTLHVRDELAGWIQTFDRYTQGGRSFWLEAFGGREYSADRKSAEKTLIIPSNSVSVLGSIQPEKLSECILTTSDDGLAARFLWAWPDPVPYHRPRRVADTARLRRIYDRLDGLRPGHNRFTDEPEGIVLKLTPDGADIFEKWRKDIAPEIAQAASLFKGFCGKLAGIILRLALASEFIAWADSDEPDEPEQISTRALVAAIQFVEDYAKPSAQRVFGDAALPAAERNAAALAKWIKGDGSDTINARIVAKKSGIPAIKNDVDARDAAIAVLIEADWLRPAPQRRGSTVGRSSVDYAVNPRVFEASAA